MKTLEDLKKDTQLVSDPLRAFHSHKFFKSGKGEYGEGDLFLGVTVPDSRKIAKKYHDLSLADTQGLLRSPYHEHRLTALFILVLKFEKSDEEGRKKIVDMYLKNADFVNNWDLVDSSAYKILGPYLFNKNRQILFDLAKEDHLWKQRIAIISTMHFVRSGDFETTLKLSEILLNHEHDLIHKAVGWLLREVGNRNMETEIEFLDKHYKSMPRTMLRYAIEKFDPQKKRYYME
jgi:3-methyladenine DNA glycosylase AlkD